MNKYTSWIPTAVTVTLAVIGALTPQIAEFEKVHPGAAVVFAGIYAVVKGLLPSPLSNGGTPAVK